MGGGHTGGERRPVHGARLGMRELVRLVGELEGAKACLEGLAKCRDAALERGAKLIVELVVEGRDLPHTCRAYVGVRAHLLDGGLRVVPVGRCRYGAYV